MNRTRYFSLCLLTLTGAFAGGYIANRAVPVVHAQNLPPMEVRGSSFTLVNPQGQTEAVLRHGTNGAELTLNDTNGNKRVEITGRGVVVRDSAGRITRESPRRSGIMPLSTSGN